MEKRQPALTDQPEPPGSRFDNFFRWGIPFSDVMEWEFTINRNPNGYDATLYLYITGMTRIYKLMAYRTCYLVPVQNSTINQIDPQICNFTVGMAMGGMYDFASFYLYGIIKKYMSLT